MIKNLRKLGGAWVAERCGFGTYTYRGLWKGAHWHLQSFAHMAPKYDGDDESFVVRWHITKDGKSVGHATSDPVFLLEMMDGKEKGI